MESKSRKIIKTVFAVHIIFVLIITFVIRETMTLRIPGSRNVILTPFREFDLFLHEPTHLFWFMQIFLNILLFIPFGLMLPMIITKFRNPLMTSMTGLLFSGAIETMQYITGRGLTEVDDVINNTIGTMIGYLFYAALMNLRKRHRDDELC